MGALLVLVGAGTFLWGMSAVVIPWGVLKKRRYGLGAMVAAIVMFATGGGMLSPTATGTASITSSGGANASAVDASQPPKDDPMGASRADNEAFAKARELAGKHEKDCFAALRKAARTHGRYNSYVVSKNTQTVCQQSARAIWDISEGTSEEVKSPPQFREAFKCMGDATFQKSSAMELSARINNDTDVHPSDVAAFRSELGDALQKDVECGSVLAAAEIKYGYADVALSEVLSKRR